MSDDRFVLTPDKSTPRSTAAGAGEPLYQTANRTQVELTPTHLDASLPPGHAARLVWRFVEGLDVQAFYDAIKSRTETGGRPAIDPQILIALWLYATIDGVGSAREVDRLCDAHDAYRWIRGGVSVNYHTLSDFRLHHQAALDALLTQSITVLLHRRVVTLHRVAQDGTRLRATAGVRSFRRAHTLRECQAQAQQQVQRTARQADGLGLSRDAAAQARAAVEQLARVDAALAELPAIEAAKQRNGRRPKNPSEARASTTDPEARIMKMADGGYRPAYNLQFATDAAGRAIVGVAVTNRGGDQQEWVSMVNQIEHRTGRVPDEMLVDGGYVSHEGLDALTRRGLVVFAPPRRRPGRPEPAPVQPRDSMAVALWRARMQTPEAQAIYRLRGSVAERVFADVRAHRMPGQIPVRGLDKVHTWALWIALAINVMRAMDIVPHLMT